MNHQTIIAFAIVIAFLNELLIKLALWLFKSTVPISKLNLMYLFSDCSAIINIKTLYILCSV